MGARRPLARKFGVGAGAALTSAAVVVAAAFTTTTACSSKPTTSTLASGSGDEVVYGASHESGVGEPVDVRNDRLAPHAGIILANMHLRAIYIGTPGVDAPPSVDPFLNWMGGSDYWNILAQYGVGQATYDGATSLTTDAVFTGGMVQNGLVPFAALDARIHEVVHGSEAGAAMVPAADAYAIFLPDGINVDSGSSGGEELVTCVTSAAYHAYDGSEPYAVLPPCNDGRSTISLSHELAEVATDPILRQGWMSDDSQDIKTGAEIADVCYRAALHRDDGFDVAELWSNADGDCMPK